MKRPTPIICVAALCLFAALTGIAKAGDAASPVGLWKPIDDKSGQARGFVRIYESEGQFFAKIEMSFTPGDETRVCTVCTDERKNQPIIGLILMRNMKRDGDEFVGGDILDSDSGTSYRCKFRLEDGGNRLVVRGFIGISLFGRSQTWYREQ